MHVLYVHPNFPAQFGHIAHHLTEQKGWKCTFVSETPAGHWGKVEKISYKLQGGATRQNHFCTRTFENAVWHCDAVLRALKDRPDVRPDLIVGHSGFGSTLFLRELYPDVPVVNLFEYYYRPHDPLSDMTFRSDLAWPVTPEKFLRSRCRNAMILLDLQNCQVGYCPTLFQKSRFPKEYDAKLRVCFDGVDRAVWNSQNDKLRLPVEKRLPRRLAGVDLPAGAKVVTYVSRGFESMRGFDIFMKAITRVLAERSDVHAIVVGSDRIAYGGDEQYTGGSFKTWTMGQPELAGADLSRCHFVGRLPGEELAHLLAASDLHLYLTVPFVLSWSMVNAMSCGAVVLGSDTAPVRELIRDGETGLLADFFSPDDFATKALRVLDDLPGHRELGRRAEQEVQERLSLEAVLPQMLAMYEAAAAMTSGLEPARDETQHLELGPPRPEEGQAAPRQPARPVTATRPAARTPFAG